MHEYDYKERERERNNLVSKYDIFSTRKLNPRKTNKMFKNKYLNKLMQ